MNLPPDIYYCCDFDNVCGATRSPHLYKGVDLRIALRFDAAMFKCEPVNDKCAIY